MCVPPWPILIILGQQVEVVIDPMVLNLPVLDHYTLGTVVAVTRLTNSAWISNQLAVNFQFHSHVGVPGQNSVLVWILQILPVFSFLSVGMESTRQMITR